MEGNYAPQLRKTPFSFSGSDLVLHLYIDQPSWCVREENFSLLVLAPWRQADIFKKNLAGKRGETETQP